MNTLHRCLALLLPVAIVCVISQSFEITQEESDADESTVVAPTETSWLKMMQLVYGPSFSNLRKQIGSEAENDDVDFVAVQKDALILAEFTSRLHQWPEIHEFKSEEAKAEYLKSHNLLETEEVTQHAADIYNAAKEKQLETAKESFVAMTKSCNVCHREKNTRWSPVILQH